MNEIADKGLIEYLMFYYVVAHKARSFYEMYTRTQKMLPLIKWK